MVCLSALVGWTNGSAGERQLVRRPQGLPRRRHRPPFRMNWSAPVFQHTEDDHRSFRMFTAQLCCPGACEQAEIISTFGVSKNSVLRSVAKYCREGNAGFFQPRRGRGPSIITEKVVAGAERLLALGRDRRQTAQELNVPYETLRKAIQQGRVREPGAAEQTAPLAAGFACDCRGRGDRQVHS